MNIGQLNRRIAIQQRSSTQDSFGQQLNTWSTVYQCWAAIEWQNSALNNAPGEFISEVISRITFRYPSVVISPGDQIIYDDSRLNVLHKYQIKALQNPGQNNEWIVALCYELQAVE